MGDQDDDGDFSTNGRIWNPPPPQSPSRGNAGESSSSVPSPLPSFARVDPIAPGIYPETLDSFRQLSLEGNNRSSRNRSREEDIPSSSSHPGSSWSDFGNYGIASNSASYLIFPRDDIDYLLKSYLSYPGYGVGSLLRSYQSFSPYGVGYSLESNQSFPGYGHGNSSWLTQADSLWFPKENRPLSFGRNNGFPDVAPSPNRGITIYGADNDGSFQVSNLKVYRGNVVTLAMNHGGSEVLKDSIDAASYSEMDEVLPEFTENIAYLMLSPIANPVVQKLIEKSNDSQRNSIARALSRDPSQLHNVCRNSHGTRAVQKLLESLKSRVELGAMVNALSQWALPLTRDTNGYHVIAHCLKLSPDIPTTKIIFDVAQNCLELATDQSGCCILQLCIDRLCNNHGDCPASQMIKTNIIQNALFLSQDCFGNYVVQHLGMMAPALNPYLVHSLQGNYVTLSMNKYGSNVVEHCLKVSNEDQVAMIIRELISFPRVSDLLTDQYGNYVVQSALNVSKGVIRDSLVNTIKSYAPMMASHVYGMKIINWLRKKNLYPSR